METSDFAWLIEHDNELHTRYRGKWVAIWQGQVIGIGDTAPAASAQAESKAPGQDYILHAIDAQTDVIYANFRVG